MIDEGRCEKWEVKKYHININVNIIGRRRESRNIKKTSSFLSDTLICNKLI